MLATLQNKFVGYNKTCSITQLEDKAVTFMRDSSFLHLLKDAQQDVWICAHTSMESKIRECQESYCSMVKAYYSEYPEYDFTLYHNFLCKDKSQSRPIIGNGCKIHPTVVMDVDGLKVVNGPDNKRIPFIHTGHVMIGDNVNIAPYTVIHRGTMGMTTIKTGSNIGALCNIGHNCSIGTNNVLAANVVFSGGVKTGFNCWFGSGSMVKHKVTITDDVVVGMGAVVTKDIKKSGVYVGNPARFLRELEEGWNF